MFKQFFRALYYGYSYILRGIDPLWATKDQRLNCLRYGENRVNLYMLLVFRKKCANIFAFYIVFRHWSGTSSWYPSKWKTRALIAHGDYIMIKIHWSLFLMVQLAITQQKLRQWLGTEKAISHYVSQCWPDIQTHICGTRRIWVNWRK